MQFLDSTNETGIVEEIDFLCDTDTTSFPLKDKARIANRWLYKCVTDILRSSNRWNFDDSNHTDLPIVTTNLVDAQQDYSLPTDHLQIIAVEVKDSSGNWTRLQEFDRSEVKDSITDHEETDGIPTKYDVDGASIFLFPAPSSSQMTLTNGLKLYITREVDGFTASDTTQAPGFAEAFHWIIPLGVSYEWMLINGPKDKADRIREEIEQLRTELRRFYGDQNRDAKIRIRPLHRTQTYL